MSDFTQEERKLLEPFFTNLDKNVFVLVNLPEVVKGALFSRYSRSAKSLRRILLEEFIQVPEVGFTKMISTVGDGRDQLVAIAKAEQFYDRVLVGYGDDSVAELGGAHIALEGISHIASKVVEDSRIGISPLEKSTRYVFFDEKADGTYQYIKEAAICSSTHREIYLSTMDMLFDTYTQLIEPLQEHLRRQFPQDAKTSDRAYRSTIRAKAADVLRGLLPAGVKTNVGLYGNGRAFEYLLIKMRASSLQEIHELADRMHAELDKVIPSFVKRAKSERGDVYVEYLRQVGQAVGTFASRSRPGRGRPKGTRLGAALLQYSSEGELDVLAALLFPHDHRPYQTLRAVVSSLSRYKRRQLIMGTVAGRKNRHHKVPRALEHSRYTFEIVANYGAYRDLQRHRILTQQRQNLTTRYGYDVPPELLEAKLDAPYREALEQAALSFEILAHDFPAEAQYVVPNAYRMRWLIELNLREVVHLTELRSSPQGHAHYRVIAQDIARQVLHVHPWARPALAFVDWTPSFALERLESEKRIDQKIHAPQPRITIG